MPRQPHEKLDMWNREDHFLRRTRDMQCIGLRLVAAVVVVLAVTACHADDRSTSVRMATTLLRQANLADDPAAKALVLKAQALLAGVRRPGPEAKELKQICKTYLKAVAVFWQEDRLRGSEQAERLFRDFGPRNPLYLQGLLYQGRHHHWRAVEGNYPQGIEISKKMFETILRHNPGHRIARMYLGRPVEPVPADLETVSNDAPEWAVAAREAMYWTRRMVHWWLDHRQAADGQLGGGWSDDVEFSKTWSFYSLSLNDRKVRDALTRIADNIWHCPEVMNGYFSGTPAKWHLVDVEHGAEWMSFSQPQMMLARYGDPRYIERNMQVIRNMGFLSGINPAGHRHFKAYYFSHELLHPRQLYHCDVPENGRYTKPGIYVMWYARHPRVMQWCREWGDAWVDHSLKTKRGKPTGFIPSEIVYETDQVGGKSGKWYRIAGYPGYDFAAGSWTTKHLMGQLVANAKLFNNPRYVEPIRRIVQWKKNHHDAPYGPEGSDGWILRKETHAEKMWGRWERLRDGLKPTDRMDQLVKQLREISAWHASTWEMNTQEVISTDRVPLPAHPSRVLMHMYTGGSGSMQAYYPDSAVAWENVELKAVPLMLEADRRHVKIRIHNFDQRRRVVMRPLELDPGVYEVRIDGQRRKDFRLAHRFEPLPLWLPARTTSLVEVAQVTPNPLPTELSDLALSETECVLDRSSVPPVLRVRVHNVGIRDSGAARVTFTTLFKNREEQIGVHQVKNISWPRELMPSFVTLQQPWDIDPRVHAIRVEVSTATPDEICVENNVIEIPIKDWLAPADFRERLNLYGPDGTEIPRPSWPVARCTSPPGTRLSEASGFVGVSRLFGPFRDPGNLRFPVRYARRQSLAWLLRDDKNLYVLVSSWKSGAAVRALAKPDKAGPRGDFLADDRIEILFQPPGKPWRSIQVNANSAVMGRTADGTSWRPSVASVHEVVKDTWCPEWWCRIEIPLKSLSSEEQREGQAWRFDIVRHGHDHGQPQRSSWSGGLPAKPQTWGVISW